MATWSDAVKFIKINDLTGFSLRHGSSDNQMIFKSLADENIDDAIGRAEKIMDFCEGRYITLEGWKGANAQRGKYTFTFQNSPSAGGAAPVVAGTPQMDEDYINQRINVAMNQVRAEYAQKDLERREKELREAKRDFERDRASVVGILIDKIAPMIRGLQPKVAGTSLGESSEDRILPEPPAPQEQQQQEVVEIDDKIVELLLRWQAVEPDLATLLEKLVQHAEQNTEKYQMAKQYL